MILQRLVEHYDRLEASGAVKLAKPGFSQQKISFCIVLEPNGQLNSFEDMRRQDGRSLQPRTMIVPGQGKPSGSGLNPCFLWDNAEYLLGWTDDPERSARAARAFEASRAMHLAFEPQIDTPAYAALCAFLRGWSLQKAAEFSDRLNEVATHFGVIRIAGEQRYVHEITSAPAAAELGEAETATAMCLVTGSVGASARLHEPAIKGVDGANTMGAKLVCFDKDAFTSYGKDQSFNAPVGTVAVFKYANALNHLLSLRERRIGLGDATIVFWADHAQPADSALEDSLAMLFAGIADPAADDAPPEEDQRRVNEARRLLTQLRDGTRIAPVNPDYEPTRFYILGLSPNASRLSVRLWIEAAAPELERRLGEHLRDLELKSYFDERPLSIRLLANATGRYQPSGKTKFDTKHVSPQLVGELARSVLTGAAYPQSFLGAMVRRIRSDSYIGFERVSAVKACIARNSRLRGAPQEIPVELDTQLTDEAYRCGRLFALLEKAQIAALGKELNSTIKDRFFAAASATPALVFPRLFRVNTHHLAKLKQGSRSFYTNALGELMSEPFNFPRQLSLEQQGRFFIGYFQERQYRPAAEATLPEETADTDE